MSDAQTETPPDEALAREPRILKRDLETGLIVGQEYPRRADGRIDWVKLIPPEHIVFNSKLDDTLVKTYGAPANRLSYADMLAEGKEVNPKHVLVLLQGFLELADIRGYTSAVPVHQHVVSYPPEAAICALTCTIDWIANEEDPDGKTSYGSADATMENTGGWGYLSAMAGNRAFVRAVRQGLRIPILGFDEIAKKDTPVPEAVAPTVTDQPIPTNTLKKAAASLNLTFEQVKEGALTKYRDKMENDPTQWKDWPDIQPRDCLTLIKLVKDKTKRK